MSNVATRMGAVPRWFARTPTRSAARTRLICFPYAGGSNRAFDHWGPQLPEWIEVWGAMLPGRTQRFSEPPYGDIGPLVTGFTNQILSEAPGNSIALFGHSMGALVAFEMARELTRQNRPPAHLFVSGSIAPHLDRNHQWHRLPDAEFLNAILGLNCIPSQLASQQQLLDAMLPTLRADFQVVETYRYRPTNPLPCGITVFGGTNDPFADTSQLHPWAQHTAAHCKVQVLDGDHFFLHSHEETILRCIASDLPESAA